MSKHTTPVFQGKPSKGPGHPIKQPAKVSGVDETALVSREFNT